MILISGCSYSVGEWDQNGPSHPGLEYWLAQDGKTAVNVGIPGGANYQVVYKIRAYLERHPGEVDKVIVFQTEFTRDLPDLIPESWNNLHEPIDLAHIWLARYYSDLSLIAQTFNCKVYLIGGVADTVWLSDFKEQYPGVQVVCQSLVNFLINDNHRINQPVYSWFDSRTLPIVEKLKSILPEKTKEIIQMVDLGYERETLIYSQPEWFYPDGRHPNRKAIKKLYHFLTETTDILI